MDAIDVAAGWFSQWIAKADYGTVPAWFGGLSLLLALYLFLRDRQSDDREQINKTAVWMTAEWDPLLGLGDFNRSVEPTEEIKLRIFEKELERRSYSDSAHCISDSDKMACACGARRRGSSRGS